MLFCVFLCLLVAIPPSPFVIFVSFVWCNSAPAKKSAPPLDTKPIEVYRMNTSMDTHTKWTETRHKTRGPIPGRERARRTVFTSRAPRSNVLTFHVLPRRSPTKAGLTLPVSVTAKFDIFSTFSPSHSKNTHHRPLSPNHLRRMPDETVQFLGDFACRAVLSSVLSSVGLAEEEGLAKVEALAKAGAPARRRAHAYVASASRRSIPLVTQRSPTVTDSHLR
jgi:hypothetical protein